MNETNRILPIMTLAPWMAGGIAIILALAVLIFVGRSPGQRALEATAQMERLTSILSRAKRIAPSTALTIGQLVRQPDYDCRHAICGQALSARNQLARSRLEMLLGAAVLAEEPRRQ